MQLVINSLNYNQSFISEEAFKCQIKQIADKCLEKLSRFALKQEDIASFIPLLLPYILKHPLYWYTNPLIKIIKEHLGNELPRCFSYFLEDIENNKDFQVALELALESYKTIISNNEDISEEQAEELLAITKISKDFDIEAILNFIISKLLSETLTLSDELYSKVFFMFIEVFRDKHNGNFCPYSKRLPNIFVNGREMLRNAAVKEKFGRLLMYFNQETLFSENIGKNLFVFFHEYWHTVQENPQYTSKELLEMFKMDSYLEDKFHTYKTYNYYYLSYECDANLNALRLLYDYFNSLNVTKYNDRLIAKMQEYRFRRDNTRRFDNFNREIDLRDYYNQALRTDENSPLRLVLETKNRV